MGTSSESAALTPHAAQVLALVNEVPRGRVTTYGDIAEAIGSAARAVGQVMARHGDEVAWWRVLRVDGTLRADLIDEARDHWLAEGLPLRGDGVDLARCRFDARTS